MKKNAMKRGHLCFQNTDRGGGKSTNLIVTPYYVESRDEGKDFRLARHIDNSKALKKWLLSRKVASNLDI